MFCEVATNEFFITTALILLIAMILSSSNASTEVATRRAGRVSLRCNDYVVEPRIRPDRPQADVAGRVLAVGERPQLLIAV